jgi:hypothetical protein
MKRVVKIKQLRISSNCMEYNIRDVVFKRLTARLFNNVYERVNFETRTSINNKIHTLSDIPR